MQISNWNLTKRLTASLAFARKHTMGFKLTGTRSTWVSVSSGRWQSQLWWHAWCQYVTLYYTLQCVGDNPGCHGCGELVWGMEVSLALAAQNLIRTNSLCFMSGFNNPHHHVLHKTICCFLQLLGSINKLALMYKAAWVVFPKLRALKLIQL